MVSPVLSSDILVVRVNLINGQANQPGPRVNITGYVEAGLSSIQNVLTRSAFKTMEMQRPGTSLQSIPDGSSAMTVVRSIFVVHNLSQSSPVVGMLNTLSCSFSTVIDLAPFSTIIISGMTGSAQPTTSNLPLTSITNSSILANAEWSQTNGTLKIIVGANGIRGNFQLHQISFSLLNPGAGHAPPRIEMSVLQKLGRQDIPATLVSDARGGLFAPLAIADFVRRKISRISDYGPHPSGDYMRTSTIHVVLIASADLRPGGFITLSGLTGALGPTSVNLIGLSTLQVLSWSIVTGTLKLSIASKLKANTFC